MRSKMNKTTSSFLEKVPEEKNSAEDVKSATGKEVQRNLAGSTLSFRSKQSPSKLTVRHKDEGTSS